MTLTLDLSPELEQRLAREAEQNGLSLDDYALRLLESPPPAEVRRAAALALLQSWIDEPQSEQDIEESEEFLRALDENRDSPRKLFPPELKGVTW